MSLPPDRALRMPRLVRDVSAQVAQCQQVLQEAEVGVHWGRAVHLRSTCACSRALGRAGGRLGCMQTVPAPCCTLLHPRPAAASPFFLLLQARLAEAREAARQRREEHRQALEDKRRAVQASQVRGTGCTPGQLGTRALHWCGSQVPCAVPARTCLPPLNPVPAAGSEPAARADQEPVSGHPAHPGEGVVGWAAGLAGHGNPAPAPAMRSRLKRARADVPPGPNPTFPPPPRSRWRWTRRRAAARPCSAWSSCSGWCWMQRCVCSGGGGRSKHGRSGARVHASSKNVLSQSID